MLNKSERAKLAKQTISKTVPDILKHNTKAVTGVINAELIRFKPHHNSHHKHHSVSGSSGDASTANTPPPPPKPVVHVVKSDSFDAARDILSALPAHPKVKPNVCVLNMASSLNPGGGVINGAIAQEESLCMRSTLYASLKHSWYRLPTLSCIYTPSVLVFRDLDLNPLKPQDQYYCSVLSVSAIKNPDLVKIDGKDGEEEVYAYDEDRDVMMAKIRGLFDVVREKGITHLVLGALGCGAYHNPPKQVARLFARVINGDRKHKGVEGGILQEIVFAIFDEGENLNAFRGEFGQKLDAEPAATPDVEGTTVIEALPVVSEVPTMEAATASS